MKKQLIVFLVILLANHSFAMESKTTYSDLPPAPSPTQAAPSSTQDSLKNETPYNNLPQEESKKCKEIVIPINELQRTSSLQKLSPASPQNSEPEKKDLQEQLKSTTKKPEMGKEVTVDELGKELGIPKDKIDQDPTQTSMVKKAMRRFNDDESVQFGVKCSIPSCLTCICLGIILILIRVY